MFRAGVIIAALALLTTGCGEAAPRVLTSRCAAFEGRTDSGGGGTLSGSAAYRKRRVASGGMTGEVVSVPIRFALAEVVACRSGEVLAEGETGEDGLYAISFSNPGPPGVYVRVSSRSGTYAASVKRSPQEPVLYGVVSGAIDDLPRGARALPALEARDTSGVAGAFNILEQGVRGGRLVEAATGSTPTAGLQWYWYPGNPDGTAYNPSARAISVLGQLADPDEWDDAVLLHEYGHYAADVYSKDDSPGGPHRLGDSTLDLRLAWSEGWATFFSSAVRDDPRHVDTSGTGVRLEFEIEGPSLASSAQYDTNELAVAAVLWDLHDDTNADEEPGPQTIPFDRIWDVVADLSAFSTVSFEDYWLHWQSGNLEDLTSVLAPRGINLWRDFYEGSSDDDLPARGGAIGLEEIQLRTLYPVGDVDHAVFTPDVDGVYTVSTSRCVIGVAGATCDVRVSNAADTVLDVEGVLPGPSADNLDGGIYLPSCGVTCPPNDADTLSSRVSFSGTAGVPLTLTITRSPSAPPSAGDLGSYGLVVEKIP